MRDPCGLCIRRSSFSYARSRVSRSEPSIPAESNEIDPSNMHKDPCQYPLPTTDDGFCSPPSASRLDLAENASAGWLKDFSKNDPLERSRSCSGRIEGSSTYAKSHIRKPLSLRPDRPNESRSNTLPQPVSDRHSRRPIHQEILEFSLLERIDGSAKEEKSKDPLEEKHALEYQTDGPGIVAKRKNENEKAPVLPLPVLPQKVTKTCTSPVPLCAAIRKRCFEREDGDKPITLNFKKTRGRTKQLKSPTGYPSTVESLRMERSDPIFKPSPSDFEPSSQ